VDIQNVFSGEGKVNSPISYGSRYTLC
jgi:hypothetical protein